MSRDVMLAVVVESILLSHAFMLNVDIVRSCHADEAFLLQLWPCVNAIPGRCVAGAVLLLRAQVPGLETKKEL
jgi:hypothetical protein